MPSCLSPRAALGLAAFAFGFSATIARAQLPQAITETAIALPEGAVERAFAAVGARTRPAETPRALGGAGFVPALAAGAWKKADTWRAWSRALAAESRAFASSPEESARTADAALDSLLEQRALLCLLALEQERWDDAWEHLRACAGSPAWLAALMPRYMPGVPAGTATGLGGRSAALADGVVLRPSLPPRSPGASAGRIDRRAMKIDGVAIGAAQIGVRVSVEVEGVQIEIEHQGGGAARFSVRIPEPAGFVVAHEYLDWFRQETRREPIALAVAPGDDVRTIYGRLEPRELALPTRLPERKPEQIESGGLLIEISAGDPERERIDAVARSLAEGPLAIACQVRELGASAQSPAASAVVVDLVATAERERKLAWLVSSVERFVLATGRAPR